MFEIIFAVACAIILPMIIYTLLEKNGLITKVVMESLKYSLAEKTGKNRW